MNRQWMMVLMLATVGLGMGHVARGEEESVPVLKDGKPPRNFEELWAGYDPRKEPLEVEVLKKWEEDGVVLQVLRYRIGVFKGRKVMMAAIYGYPKGGSKLPGLVQVHGGGQFADYKAPLTNAKRGYATISLAWAGRIGAPGYSVDSGIVNLFIEGKTADPAYKVTTDWKGFNGYHAVDRKNRPAAVEADWKLDDVSDSPRNSPWFLWTLGARRALTFLEQQPEVDPGKLGVYGHSMGGRLTVLTAATDARVKAAAPSSGGVSARSAPSVSPTPLDDGISLSHITCPIMFLSPANDFHGHINDLQKALGEIQSRNWRVTSSPHHNHQDTEPYMVAGPLWFDQYLKAVFKFPETPDASLVLQTKDGVPLFNVTPDASRKILSVDVFYTQQGQLEGEPSVHENTMARFWHHAAAGERSGMWTAALPLFNVSKPLWVYANVLYRLDEPVTGAGYYYEVYTAKEFNLSSKMLIATPDQFKASGVTATDKPSLVIEKFEDDWQKEWFTYDLSGDWARKTHKLYDPKWKAPVAAKLALEVKTEHPNKLVVGLDNHAAEVHLDGGSDWQSVALAPADFRNAAGTVLTNWAGIRELRLGAKETLRGKTQGQDVKLELGAEWKGTKPVFQNMRWIESKQE